MMGGTPTMDHLLRQVMQRIERSRRRQKRLERAIRFLDKDPEYRIYTRTQGYQPLRQAARYWFMLALIWRLLGDDKAADEKLKRARDSKDRTPELEAEVLYEHITLLVRHGWRIDAVPNLYKRIVALYKPEPELYARALTDWGKFLYNQKNYDEAHTKFTDAEEQWALVQGQLGHIMSHAEMQGMMETNFALLKTLTAQKADRATINRVAQKTIQHDRVKRRKFAAATKLRPITNKASNG